MTQSTEQFHLPEQYNKTCQRLTTLVAKHAQRLLEQEYWSPKHLKNIQEHAGQSYTYIRDSDKNLFEDTKEYLYSRFKRCIYARVAQTLDTHTDGDIFEISMYDPQHDILQKTSWWCYSVHHT